MYYSFAILCFHEIPEHAKETGSVTVSVSCSSSWAPFLLLGSFCFILFHYYPTDACWFSNEIERGWMGMRGEVRRNVGGRVKGEVGFRIYCIKIHFQ